MKSKKPPLLPTYKFQTARFENHLSPTLIPVSSGYFGSTEKNFKFSFLYEPLLEEDDYLDLLKEFGNAEIVSALYSNISSNYYFLYWDCIAWYSENKSVAGAFDFDEQLSRYDAKLKGVNCCPIIEWLKMDKLNNLNFYSHFTKLIRKAVTNRIENVNYLMYGKEDKDLQIRDKPNREFQLLLNSVNNIIYRRFRSFLEAEKIRCAPVKTCASLMTCLGPKELKSLHRLLVEQKFIEKTALDFFTFWFYPNQMVDVPKIKWLKSKSMAVQLFESITSNFSISLLNACCEKKGTKKFDSNDRKAPHAEIESLVKPFIKKLRDPGSLIPKARLAKDQHNVSDPKK
jgi:hypothetical protein